jgi:DNA damage-binding protein 1
MSYLYAVTSQKATAVNFSVVCNFCSPNEKNLILAKNNHLEIYNLKENGLALITDVTLFGSIKALEFYRPTGVSQDVLFVLTERKKIAILAYDSVQKKIITKSMGNVKDRIGRDAEMGQRGFIDPEGKMIGMILYDGLLKVCALVSIFFLLGFISTFFFR